MSKKGWSGDSTGPIIGSIILIFLIIEALTWVISIAVVIIIAIIMGLVWLISFIIKQSKIDKLKNKIKNIFQISFEDLRIKPEKNINVDSIEEILDIKDKNKRTKAAVILSENENIELGIKKFEEGMNEFFETNRDLLNKNQSNAYAIVNLNEDFNNNATDLLNKFKKNKLKYDVQLDCLKKLLLLIYTYKESFIDLMKYVNKKDTVNLSGIQFNSNEEVKPIIMSGEKGPFDFWGTDNKSDKDDELEKKMKNYNLEEWEKEEVRKGHQDITSFEEDDLEDDDDYYGED